MMGALQPQSNLSRGIHMLLRRIALSTFAFVLSLSAVTAQTNSRSISPEDYLAFEFASDPQISPDGKLVAYVVTTIDRGQNRRHSSIWMVGNEGNRASSQFTTSAQSSNSPRWSPDGKWLAFLSARPAAETASSATSAGAN